MVQPDMMYPGQQIGMPVMQGEMVQGGIPGQAIYLDHQGEAVLPEEIKPPFCGQCGGKTELNLETSEWYCTNCNITVPGPAVPSGWMPEQDEKPQMETEEQMPQLPEGEPEDEALEEAEENTEEEEVPENEGEESEGLSDFKKPGEEIEK
jgi:ribosomal protein L37AE/L43A